MTRNEWIWKIVDSIDIGWSWASITIVEKLKGPCSRENLYQLEEPLNAPASLSDADSVERLKGQISSALQDPGSLESFLLWDTNERRYLLENLKLPDEPY